MNQENIGKYIVSLRKENNMTQQQLAEKMGVTDKSVSRWENGYTLPDISMLCDLADILHTTLPELINGRKMTMEELLVQKETINNLIELESEQQSGYNRKEMGLLMLGLGLTSLAFTDNNIHFLSYIFTPNAASFMNDAMIGLGLVFNFCGIFSVAKYKKKVMSKVKAFLKK